MNAVSWYGGDFLKHIMRVNMICFFIPPLSRVYTVEGYRRVSRERDNREISAFTLLTLVLNTVRSTGTFFL